MNLRARDKASEDPRRGSGPSEKCGLVEAAAVTTAIYVVEHLEEGGLDLFVLLGGEQVGDELEPGVWMVGGESGAEPETKLQVLDWLAYKVVVLYYL